MVCKRLRAELKRKTVLWGERALQNKGTVPQFCKTACQRRSAEYFDGIRAGAFLRV